MTLDDLIAEVFACTHCEGVGLPFSRSRDGRFYRFPPIIGATGPAALLFVGINPRVSDSNQVLHDDIIENFDSFAALAKNRVLGHAYIARNGLEDHYRIHIRVAESLFPAMPFESVAAVTELHFCASESSTGFPRDTSRCADKFLGSVLRLVAPKIIFAVGNPVERTLSRKFRNTLRGHPLAEWVAGQAPIISLRHPNSRGEKEKYWQESIAQAAAYLAALPPNVLGSAEPSNSA